MTYSLETPSHCAMCDKSFPGAPQSGMRLPPKCISHMKGSRDIDPDNIVSPVYIDLCESDAPIAKRMIQKHETSPLPECDANHARYDLKETRESRGLSYDENLGTRMIKEACLVVRADQNDQADHILDYHVNDAKAAVLSLRELGIL